MFNHRVGCNHHYHNRQVEVQHKNTVVLVERMEHKVELEVGKLNHQLGSSSQLEQTMEGKLTATAVDNSIRYRSGALMKFQRCHMANNLHRSPIRSMPSWLL